MNPSAPTIDHERLARITTLYNGSHNNPPDHPNNAEPIGCVNEMIAWVTHEPHTYMPGCVDPVISEVMYRWNDWYGDDNEARTKALKPYIEKVIGTKGSEALSIRRLW